MSLPVFGFVLTMLLVKFDDTASGSNAPVYAGSVPPAPPFFSPTQNAAVPRAPSQTTSQGSLNGSPSFAPSWLSRQPSPQSEGPSFVSLSCEEGSFVDCSRTQDDTCSKCSPCPVDSFSSSRNADFDCQPCPFNSFTYNETGSTKCIRRKENLLNTPYLVAGYVFVAINWALALFCGRWTVLYRNSPVIETGEMGFFLLICCGTMLSSSAVLLLSFEAGEGEDKSAATRACVALPWLYWTGLTLQNSCLYAKTCWLFCRLRGAEDGNLQAHPCTGWLPPLLRSI